MGGIVGKWSSTPSPSIPEKIGGVVKPKGPLKPRVRNAIQRLQKQTANLDAMLAKLQERDSRIFQRIVEATQQHDAHGSRVLSNELAEIRKVVKILGSARMALEQIELRLTTYHDLGDTITTIMPTIGLMRSMKSSLAKFMPGADQEINSMAEMLGGFMVDTFSGEAAFGVDAPDSEETGRILREAAAVAENSVSDRFPDAPAPASADSKIL